MSDDIREIIRLLRWYSTDLEDWRHKRTFLFPQNLGKSRWSPNHGFSTPFKEPKKLRLEGAKSALEAMAEHIEYCLENGVFE